jgi:hypothetical protein
MFSAHKVESPEVTFWVIDGPDGTRVLPEFGWGTALTEHEADVWIGRLDTAYLLGVAAGRDEMAAVAREAANRVRAAGFAEGLAEGRTDAEMRRG